MKSQKPETRVGNGTVGLALQLLFGLLIALATVTNARAAACPTNMYAITQSGNATAATSTGSVTNAALAINAPANTGVTATTSNSAKISSTGVLTLDLGQTVPGATTISLSLARTSSTSRVLVSASLNNTTYSTTTTLGSTLTTNTILARPTYTIPDGGARYIRLAYSGAAMWVDGVIYSQICQTYGAVSGTLYTDNNANNALDAAETKLPNVTVWLYDSAGNTLLQTKTTDTNGAYSFTSVTAGNYQVKVDTADTDLPAGAAIGTTHPLTAVAVTAGTTTANQNFGFDIASIPANTDYGDAPDTGSGTAANNYQTKHSDDGPRHTIIPKLMIGAQVDADNGSLQNANADADDTSGSPDDEDGLINPPIIPTTAGQSYALTAYVKNETGTTAYLTAYIDFNRDGDFLDTGEKSDTKYIYWNGYTLPGFTLPTGLTAGTVYGRMRLSQTQAEAESPVGAATSGEVEDFTLTVSAGPLYDFGDAPATYGIARHTINNSIHLGNNRPDAEAASQHSYNAMGDGYDEDGAPKQTQNTAITLFPILKMTASSYSVGIEVTNTAGAAATLFGWIDFDQNGVFDADEAASVAVPNNTSGGTVNLSWNSVPVDIKLGTTFIRLRLTTDTTVTTSTPGNNASNGEVEDYPIAIAMDIPPDSANVSIVRGEAPACSSTILTDNFDDLPIEQYFGQNTSATPYVIRNWTATGGGADTYARTVSTALYPAQGTSVYFGNGFIRRFYPDVAVKPPEFDANGRLLSPPDAIELRDNPDDTTPSVNGAGESDWGPEPVKLSRTFSTTAGQKYRLYFSAIPEDAGNDYYASGIMRVDTPSGSIHFKAPGGMEGIQKYRIEFTATASTSTISFINYGHLGTDGGWCDPNSTISGAWCSVGGIPISKNGNELIIDDVSISLASACPTSNISGSVYIDKNANNTFDTASETGIGNIAVTLYDNNATTNTSTDDTKVATVTTAANGSYSFANISSTPHYRIEVDARDNDLPASAVIGTTNPLADVTVAAGTTVSNQNFGFDLVCDTSAGQFGGMVFRDYNQNGIRESQEEGIAGVTVTAYNTANSIAATATTDARGWYTLSGLTTGMQYRLEYTGLATGVASGTHGSESFTNVRFITASSSCAANYGVSDPVEYCQATPYVAANVYVNGNPSVADVGNYTSIHTFPYTATGPAYAETPAASAKASTTQTGALWGMAYQKPTKTLYASAAMRRFSGLGSLGTGGIYKINMTDPAANTGASAYIDVRTIGIDTGSDVRNAADSCNNLASSPWSPSHDVAAWDAVGKIGIGDIDYDEAGNRLWLVNLNDRKLYAIGNVSPSTTPTSANVQGGYAINLPSPYSCTSGTFRPWAVKYYRGYVYVGGVCDASSDPYTLSKVRGYVLKFNPANTAAGFSYVKDFAFDQSRHGYGYDYPGQWYGWIPQADAVGWPYFHSPIVGNLEFDTDGSIIVGVIDRAGLQNGNGSYDEPSCTDTSTDYTDAKGDVLRLCKTDTGYLTENEPGCTTDIPVNSKSSNEYYWGDMGPTANAWENMNEIASGGLSMAPGKEHVLMSSYDTNSWGSNGIAWLNNKTGAADNRYYVSWTTFGKATGMGELEVLCDPAPVEIGNRVWLDADKDGIQDAGEAGINNVTVSLTCGTDSATTTTDTAGEYYFSNATGGNATFMGNGESCSLSVNNTQANLSGYSLTTQNADSKTDNNYQTDIRDSDAAASGSNALISFTAGNSGQNNHSLDFGYKSASLPGTISGTVYLDGNSNGSFDAASETGIANITVSLYNENATPANLLDDTLVNTATTNASGAYSFTNVDSSRTYRITADTTDPDLPANTTSTTTNPLTAVSVTAGGTTANKNFGFAQMVAACSAPSVTTTGANASLTWNHNPYTPASQTVGGHPVPAILNTTLVASAANEVRSNLSAGATDWEMYAEAASIPATLAEAISNNKYLEYSFTTQSSLSSSHILYGLAMSTLGPNNTWNHSGKYKVHIRFDDNAAFASPTVVKNMLQIDEDNPTTGGNVSEGPLYGSDFYISHYNFDTSVTLDSNKTYYVRFYLYDVAKTGVANGTAGRIIFDDLLLKSLDCSAAPSTLMSISDAVVTEGNSGLTNLNFPVQLSAAAPAGGVSFNYATIDMTATVANNDYQAKSGTITIPAGSSSGVISIPVVGDTNVESNEKLRLDISNVVRAQSQYYPQSPQGTIIDDDAVVACNASSGHFGGMVFQDYNQNGSRETGEIGLAGVTVTAYNSSNTAAATATTDASGWYKLTGLTNGTAYRLEFTSLPTGVEAGAAGTNSATSTQFVTASATCNADLGVANPLDYCQADPKLLTARYVNGDSSASGTSMAGSFGALLSFSYSSSGISPTINQDALTAQVGSIWGLSYNRHSKKAFASAMIRRHSGLGPLGIGGIYVLDYASGTPTVSNFLNVDGLAGIDAGSIGSNSARSLPGDPYLPNHDPTTFDKVGKEGLGDLELSEDGNTLYVTNLYSRKIIKVDLTTYNSSGTVPTTATEISLPAVSCTNGVARPFALKYYRGKLYAGITCTGENSGSSADLKASIQVYDGSSWTEKLQVPLNYQTWHADHMRASEYSRYNIPWVSSLSSLTLGDHGTLDWADDSQLLLSGIEFDSNGDMLLGFIDRTGLQFGQANYGTDTSSTRFYGVFSNGELLKASYNASTGVYTLENAGSAGGMAGEGAKTGTDSAWPYGGPGGGEFYGGEKFSGHTENSYGALAVIPGRQEVALNAMNPFNITTGGTIWLDNNTGTRTRGAQLYGADNRFLGKAVGLGDIEVLCDPAPVEIGNRVWADTDKDGLQDAGEAGISNVAVSLTCGTDTANTTTNAAGEYYFTNKSAGNATFMGSGESCILKVNSSQANLSSYTLTTQNADSKTDNNRFTDIRDSDAANNAGTAEIAFTAGSSGQNNHGLDFGYKPNATTTGGISGKVFEDVNYGGGAGRNASVAGAAGVNGARVELYSSTGSYVSTTTTAADGSYSFTSLASSNYYVRVVNDTLKSTRTGSDGTERGIQTYRTDGTTANSNEVGGRNPAVVDAAANTTSQTLNTTTFLLSGGGQAQSIQPVTVASSNISGVDFGFNFSTVVNTNDSGQGSLRQGILNINLLANTGLAQTGQNNTYGLDAAVIKEVLLFNIPATSDPLGRADLCGGANCKITVNTQLPAVAKQPAIIDATTQPGYMAGTPGVPRIHIVPAAGLDATGFTMDYDAPDSTFRGFAITGFRTKITNRGLTVNSERTLVESCYIGVTPAGTADGNGNGIELQWTQSAVIGGASAAKRNIVSANKTLGIFFNTGAAGGVIQNNHIGTNPAGTAAMGNETTGIDTESGSGTKILDNVIAGNPYNGIELGFTSGGPGLANAIIQGNRIGLGVNGEAIGNGVGIINYGVSDGHTIGGTGAGQGNIIAYNLTGGVKFYNNNSSNSTISGNSIYANGTLGIDLGNNGVTTNDANDTDTGANSLINFPMLSELSLAGTNLTVKGCAPAGSTVELFEADVSVGGKATPGDNKQGKSKDYGEGQTYLASFVEGSASDTDTANCTLATDADGNNQTGMKAFSVAIPAPAAFVVGDIMTATATLSGTGTSEFSPTLALANPGSIAGKVFEDVNYGGGAGRPASIAGAVGVNGAQVEIYGSTGALVSSTTTAADGFYTLNNLVAGNYYVRVVNATIKSTRTGSDGTERGIQTYRTDGTTANSNEVGGRNPAAVDAAANTTSQTLNTTTFLLSGGGQAQSIQPVTVASNNISGVNFGFNFDTIVNANDSGQGSLRQFILNANLLGGDASLAQTGRTAGKENAIFELSTSDPKFNAANQYWSIAVATAMPDIGDDVMIDASTQPARAGFAFANRPVVELDGTIVKNLNQWHNGLILAGTNGGSTVKYLAINRFQGAGIKIRSSKNNTVSFNYIGTDPLHSATNIGNQHGIEVVSSADLNLISDNLIAHNSGDGIHAWNFNGGGTEKAAIIAHNSTYANGGLGINLEAGNTNGSITTNDANDADTGANSLLNFPMLSQITGTGGNITIKGCTPAGSTVELFEADVSPGGKATVGSNKFGKSKDYGEGQTYLASFVEGSASDTDTANCTLATDADSNNQTGMKAFTVTIPAPAGIITGDIITATATLASTGTSEFSPTVALLETHDIAGKVFEDVNYGGGNGRAFNAATAGMAGISAASVELRTTANALLATTTTAADGSYTFKDIPVGSYSVQVAVDSVNSTRTGSNGTELGVMTYRTDGTAAGTVTNSIGGQAVQPVSVATTNLSGVDFGFNFDTVSNASDNGAGSLRQFLLNANLLGGDTSLAQAGLTAGKENAVLMLQTTDGNYVASGSYWSIPLQSALPIITAPIVLDGSLQSGFSNNPVIELAGNSAGAGTNGLTLNAGAAGSTLRKLAINRFGGNGIYVSGGGGHKLQANHIGIDPPGTAARANTGAGIKLEATSDNLIGGIASDTGNLITNNGGNGVVVIGATSASNSILGNSIYNNGGLGIDLGADTVTNNDAGDGDSGPNKLLNFPEVQVNSFGSNATKIITYDFDLDVPSGDYRLEFFINASKDPSGYGEGQVFIGSKDISHPGTGSLNFKGTFNANQAVGTGIPISSTLTRKMAAGQFAETSEFSGIRDGIPTQVCDSLTTGSGIDTMMVDENAAVIKLLEAKDSSGNPITYVISGGADKNMFAITNPVAGATLDCATVKFISDGVVITKALAADAETRAIVPPGYLPSPGNFELPLDSNKDNVYDLQVTATLANGQKITRDLSVRVMNTNEAPTITSAATLSLNEDSAAKVLDIVAQDPDAGTSESNGLTYSITGGVDAKLFEVTASGGILSFRAVPDYDAPMDTNRDNLYEVEVTVSDTGGLTNSKLFKISVVNNTADDGVLLNVKTLLQGAYDGNTGLMSSDLNALGLLPTKQPYKSAPFSYSGTETMSSLVQEATGNNAVVDWALVDLRSSTTSIVSTRALLLQRDGDLVDPQTGAADLHFANVKAGNYYISVRHRNHLAVISASPLSLSNSVKLVNFASSATAVKGDESRLSSGKVAMMWAGDINGSNSLTANGPGNDVTSLLSGVITSMDNVQGNTNYIMRGYLTTDLNMDGKTLFTGPGNDASLLVGNIILHPLNSGFAANYIVKGGLQ